MALKIRLSRGGSKKRPFYRIVVAEAASPRDGRYVERVGHYNPMLPKDDETRLVVNGERVAHWMGMGAKPTDLAPAFEIREQPKKSAVGKKRAEREEEAAAAAAAAAEEAAAEAAAAAEAEAAPAEEAPAEAEAAEAEAAPAEEAASEEAPAEEA